MPTPCSACATRNLSCIVSPTESSRCLECVRRGLSRCDVLGITPRQLSHIISQHDAVEAELELAETQAEAAAENARRIREQIEAEAEAANEKVRRLRKQKKMWLEKMSRAISRGLNTVEELEELERQEIADKATFPAPDSSFDWSSIPPDWLIQDSAGAGVGPVGDLDPHALPGFPLAPLAGSPRCSPPLAVQGSSDGTPLTSQDS